MDPHPTPTSVYFDRSKTAQEKAEILKGMLDRATDQAEVEEIRGYMGGLAREIILKEGLEPGEHVL